MKGVIASYNESNNRLLSLLNNSLHKDFLKKYIKIIYFFLFFKIYFLISAY
jgi:hypothetical protein